MSRENIKIVEDWIMNISIYPPSEMYFQAPKSKEKKERRTKELCEGVYRFNWEGSKYPHPVGTTRDSVREMVVLDKLITAIGVVPNYDPVVKMVAKFLDNTYNLLDELSDLYEKCPQVKEWATSWPTGNMRLMSIGEMRLYMFVMGWASEILELKSDADRTKFADEIAKEIGRIAK